MTSAVFYPYAAAPDSIKMGVHVEDVPELASEEGGVLQLGSLEQRRVSLIVSAIMPDRLVRELVPDAEPAPVELLLTGSSVASRRRTSWKFSGDGIYEARVDLDLDEWSGYLDLQVRAIRAAAAPPDSPAGYAGHRGAVLAWSRPCRLEFDRSQAPTGSYLPVEWVDFTDAHDPWLAREQDQLFALELRNGLPRLYLNAGVEWLREVLEAEGTRGARARARDSTYALIVHQVWSSLLASALAALAASARMAEGPPDDVEPTDMLTGLEQWQSGALRHWAPYLFPDRQAGDALDQLVHAGLDPARHQEILLQRLPGAVQRFCGTAGRLDGLMRELER